MSRLPKPILAGLREARDMMEMTPQKFSSGFPTDFVIECDADGAIRPGAKPVHQTEFIVEKTRLWRSSWVIRPLDVVIDWASGGVR